jgi:hypothetical protein
MNYNNALTPNERFGVSRGVARRQFCGNLEVCRPSEPLCSPARTASRRHVGCKFRGCDIEEES